MTEYYDPYDLLVGVVAAALEKACKTDVDEDDPSRVALVETYDFSGDPTKAGLTANKILVAPDPESGPGRGDYPESHAIGRGARTWVYHVTVDIEAFTVKTTRDRDEVRDIISKIAGRARAAIVDLAQKLSSERTADGHWVLCRADQKYLQGGGTKVKDAGRTKSIRGEQQLVVGFVLQYL